MASIQTTKVNLEDLTGPLLESYHGNIGLDTAVQKAAYNMMMTYLQDLIAGFAAKSAFAKFFFTGPLGFVFQFFLSHLISYISVQGKNFAIGQVHVWHQAKLERSYMANMKVYYQFIDVKAILTEADKQHYKRGVKNELKKFFNLSRFLKSK